MKRLNLKRIWAALAVFLVAAAPPPKITLWLIGDSTMSVKHPSAYPETGWGMPFAQFFDSTVVVDNRAKNGRSTRIFLTEQLWQPVYEQLKPGDYVFIQFGHNDESKEKTDRYTTPEEYKANLTRFIAETRARQAIPVLLTPVSRRKFINGRAVETHAVYADVVRKLAVELQTAFIDLDAQSRELYQRLGEDGSGLLFVQLQAGEHPNYPEGKMDNTHFNELGARKIAQLVLAEIRLLYPGLASRVVKPQKK